MMNQIAEYFYRLPLGVWVFILAALALAIFWWLSRDIKRQKQWREDKEAKIAARKARLAKRDRKD